MSMLGHSNTVASERALGDLAGGKPAAVAPQNVGDPDRQRGTE